MKEDLAKKNDAAIAETGGSVLGFLNDQADKFYEPGFITIKIGRGTTEFSSPGFGSTEELTGIILSVELTRALWSAGTAKEQEVMDKWSGSPPLCSSRNNYGAKGEFPKPLDDDTPNEVRNMLKPPLESDMSCSSCHWNQFGSAIGGSGKMCKEMRRFLIYQPDVGVSGVLTITPSSLRNWANYRAGLQGKHFSNVVTKITLNPMSRGKLSWSVVNFSAAGEAPMDMIAPLGRMVSYKGQPMMEVEALVAEFLNLEMAKDSDYDMSANGETKVESDELTATDEF